MPRRLSLPQCGHIPAAYAGPAKAEVLEMREKYLSPGLIHVYKEPLMIVEGHLQYVWDEAGTRYLDCYGGIVSISAGHCHPTITQRIQEQVGRLTHTTTLYAHPTIGRYAKKLAEHMPEGSGLRKTSFTNSGSEANEVAILVAREFSGNLEVISLRNGYHGGMTGTMGATGTGTWKFKMNMASNQKFTMPGYCYRCPLGLTYPSCGVKCAKDVAEVIKYETSGNVAAFIAEPIQGVGGVIVPPKEYFGIVYETVRKHGGLCIADEVQTGWGRTGEHFWGFENWGVTPDIVTMAKGIGNGFPLGAMTTRDEISAVLKGRLHFNTFAGNPLAMTMGLATLEVIDEEGLQRNAKEVGGYLKGLLLELQERHPMIGEVRGMGLMLGVELVKDRASKEPAAIETAELLELARERQLVLGRGGIAGNVLRIKPPLCITKDDAAFLAGVLEECLTSLERR
jgi:alanine-glyoxylate transaminase/(R)-3-amino-2-methylpropionate-pyruvate transaminase